MADCIGVRLAEALDGHPAMGGLKELASTR